MRLFVTDTGLMLESAARRVRATFTLDALFADADPIAYASAAMVNSAPDDAFREMETLRTPLQSQEIWAAGVTYFRSRTARMEESKVAGGGTFYDRVYEAARPELFFKATPHRVVAPGGSVRMRGDSQWNVPEPELTLAINARGKIFGYTLGNDMSSRDIEGENPLYLPQAKVYDGCAALGPCLVITDTLPAADAVISIEIRRNDALVFGGETPIGRMRRSPESLADWLFRENRFPHGCYLMTGTGIVPPDTFTLHRGDEIRISMPVVGTLVNWVA